MVNCHYTPLDKVLIDLTKLYGVELSFDSELLSKHKVSINNKFESVDKLLNQLLYGLPLDWELTGGAYVIFPKEIDKPKQVIGKIIDSNSGEPLPFAYIEIDSVAVVSDEKGNFVVTPTDVSLNRVKASYLGFYKLDTLQNFKSNNQITLRPSMMMVDEVVVTSSIVERATQVGEKAGLITINQQIAGYLPGSGDNAIFSLLRVQPGVLASGEQSNELILWGSPEGTSRTYYDNIPLWGLSNFNDNISVINPFMVSLINLHRGGYGVDSPDAAGGVAEIRSKSGNSDPSLSVLLNNETINSALELPVGKKSRILASFRQNYQNLFDSDNFKQVIKLQSSDKQVFAESDYNFLDCNLKYTFNGDSGDLFYLSTIYGRDKLGYDINYQTEMVGPHEATANLSYLDHQSDKPNIKPGISGPTIRDITQSANQRKEQLGVSTYYGKTWSRGITAAFITSYSQLRDKYILARDAENTNSGNVNSMRVNANNNISDFATKFELRTKATISHNIKLGLEYNRNDLLLKEDNISENIVTITEHSDRTTLYAEDNYTPIKQLSITAGVRTTLDISNKKLYANPRISLKYQPNDKLRANVAWGLYNQYIVRTSVADDSGNYVYSWNLAGVNDIPTLQSQQIVTGVAYTPKNYIFTIDGYYKAFRNLTQYVTGERFNSIYQGDSRTYGLDIYAKRDFKGGSSVWISYSLAKNKEHFDHFRSDEYLRSPQDQRHELKCAAIYRIGKFHLSATYVYGSGFPVYTNIIDKKYTEDDYNRLDMSGVFTFKYKWVSGDIGISILNVTNTDNEKYNSFSRVPISQQNGISIESGSTPFTPLLYLKLKFK